MTGFWSDKHVLVTGAGGFLGTAVTAGLADRGPARVSTPSSTEVDLRDRAATNAMFDELRPDLVVHLAASVGGIGANRERPADLYLDNLLMGTFVLLSLIHISEPTRLESKSRVPASG